jgi:hypothetical protein
LDTAGLESNQTLGISKIKRLSLRGWNVWIRIGGGDCRMNVVKGDQSEINVDVLLTVIGGSFDLICCGVCVFVFVCVFVCLFCVGSYNKVILTLRLPNLFLNFSTS